MARESTQRKTTEFESMCAIYQEVATPGDPHKMLAEMAGTWNVKSRWWIDPAAPPMESTGTSEQRMVLGGRFLEQDFKGEMMDGPFSGIGFTGYDNHTKKYVSTWMDTMGTAILNFEGEADGRTITQFSDYDDPVRGPLRWRSVTRIGNLLQDHMSRYDDAEVAYRKAIELDEKDSDPWNDLGNLLMDHLGRIQEAEAAYRSAIELDLNDPYPKENFAYFLLSQPQRVEEAEKAYNEAFSLLPEHGKQLLTAFRALSRDNFGEASESIAKVLGENHPELYTEHYDDLLRILRLAKGRGYGDRLLAFLAESGLGERNWPLYAAFDAYLHGEAKLRNVNPEVRGAAQQIYDWLASNQKNAKQVEIAGEKGKRRK